MIRPELILRLPNSPGALAGICRLLSDEHVNIVALALETNGRLHLVVDNPVRATGVKLHAHRRRRSCRREKRQNVTTLCSQSLQSIHWKPAGSKSTS